MTIAHLQMSSLGWAPDEYPSTLTHEGVEYRIVAVARKANKAIHTHTVDHIQATTINKKRYVRIPFVGFMLADEIDYLEYHPVHGPHDQYKITIVRVYNN